MRLIRTSRSDSSATREKGVRARWWWAVLAVVAAVGLVAGTWALASRFESPAQREAAAAPPSANAVVVEVTRGDLKEQTTVMASAEASGARSLPLPRPNGTAVVTATGVNVGEDLSSGQVVTWVNDRPVFALAGTFPMYRDIGEGDSGADVTMVQEALRDLGYNITATGSFGPLTASCIQSLYQKVGSQAPTRPAASGDGPGDSSSAQGGADKDDGTPAPAAAPATKAAAQIMLPASEVMVLSGLPSKVAQVPDVGTVLTDSSATLGLSSSTMTLTAPVPGNMAARLGSGKVSGTAVLDGTSVPVKVASVDEKKPDSTGQGGEGAGSPGKEGSRDSGGGAGGSGSVASLTPTSGEIPASWAGRKDVLVTLNLTAPLTGVLTVPQRAIATDAQGSSSVLVQGADGGFTQVTVTVSGCVASTCALAEPEAGSVLTEGAKVRVDR